MASNMQVAVTGATGFVGRSVVRELLSRGHSVRALIRDRDKARKVLPSAAGMSFVSGDVLDDGRAEELIDGCDACINLIGILREDRQSTPPKTFDRCHPGAARALVSACEKRGVKRFLHMSALGVSEMGPARYQITKFEAEMIVRLSALDWTIMRPGLIHGKDGEFVGIVKGWASGNEPPFIFLPYFTREVNDHRVPLGVKERIDPTVQPVFVEDVAKAFADALTNPRTIGEVYNLAGPERLTWPELLRFMRNHLPGANDSLQPWGIPSNVGAAMAKAASKVGLGGLLPYDEGMALMGGEDSTAALDKAAEHLNFNPRPFRATFEKYAGSVGS